mgnify:CR=1 FL=1
MYHGKRQTGEKQLPGETGGCCDNYDDTTSADFEILPENIPIKIVYEDDDLLVVDKPAGLVVHPGHGNYTGTLVNALAWYLKDDPTYDPNDPALGLVHRIDKDTSAYWLSPKSRKQRRI